MCVHMYTERPLRYLLALWRGPWQRQCTTTGVTQVPPSSHIIQVPHNGVRWQGELHVGSTLQLQIHVYGRTIQ